MPQTAKKNSGSARLEADADLKSFRQAVGHALLTERRRLGVSQQHVAELLGIEPESVSRIENGVIAPTLARLRQFSRAYGCSLAAIVGQASDQLPDIVRRIGKELEGLPDSDRVFVAEQAVATARHLKVFRRRVR